MTSNAYQRVVFEGITLNRRTVAFVQQVRQVYADLGGTGKIHLIQGSYNKGGVAASAGTHDGGGAYDARPEVEITHNWQTLQKANRLCGGASWERQAIPGVWEHHVHTIVIGDKEMSPAALKQVQDYHAHLDGMADHAHDGTWRPTVIPTMLYPLPTVDLSNVTAEAKKTKGHQPLAGVRRIQQALNLKTGTHLTVDGIFGPTTKSAYARYEKQNGGDGNGIPGRFALMLLGAARFNVKD